MPRIAREGRYSGARELLEEWNSRTGNGTSTYDVCSQCWEEIEGNDKQWPSELRPYNGEPEMPDRACIAEDGCDHPPYGEEQFDVCACCGKALDEDRDG